MRFKLFTLLTLALAALFIVSGCSKDSKGTSVTDDTTLNYEDEYGGYTTSDEQPGFGDDIILTDMSDDAETPVDPEPAFSHVFDSLDASENVDVYCMKILWGQLDGDSTAQDVIDWSGSLAIQSGAIRIATLIRFEAGDHLQGPRSDPKIVEWTSYTKPSFDGIMVFIYDSPDERAQADNVVTFTTGPYTRTFSISELANFSEIVDVDDAGNKISFESFYVSPQAQKDGLITGRWVKKGMQRGVFYGRWIAYDGRSMGHLRGHFGVSLSGDQVFFGKWITSGGKFRGLLRGSWETSDPSAALDPVNGTFEGVWADRSRTVRGRLGGVWTTRPFRGHSGDGGNNDDRPGSSDDVGGIPHAARHGFFQGRYAETVPTT